MPERLYDDLEHAPDRDAYFRQHVCDEFSATRVGDIDLAEMANERREDALLGAPLAEQVSVAFVYGSMAAGTAAPHSDVDVMVIGDASFSDVTRSLHPEQSALGREINPTVMSAAEFNSRRRARDGFVRSVSSGPKIWLLGGEDELAKLGKGRPAASARSAG